MAPVPKPAPRWLEKAKRRADEARAMKACYAAVDARDGRCCRVCRKRVGGIGLLEAAHHHHLIYRSRGGTHETATVLTLCVACHQAVHDAKIRLTGNADERSPHTGALCGVRLERYTEGGWKVERMV